MDIISLRFIAGITLIALNYPLGWGGIIAGTFLFRKTRLRRWCLAGSGVYGISWVMMAAGIYLAGPEGMTMVRNGGWPISLVLAVAMMTGCVTFWKMHCRKEGPVMRHALMLREETRLGLTIPPIKSYNNLGLVTAEFIGNNDEFTDPDTGAVVFGNSARSGSRMGS